MNNNFNDPNNQFQNQPPYGQQPYGQPPYGQPPYGQQPYNQFQNRRPVPQGSPPGNAKAGIGLGLGIGSIILTIIGVFPAFIAYADKFVEKSGKYYFTGSRPSPALAVFLSVLTVAMAITGLVLATTGGSANQRAGFRRGGVSVTGIVFGIIGIVVAATGLLIVGFAVSMIEGAIK